MIYTYISKVSERDIYNENMFDSDWVFYFNTISVGMQLEKPFLSTPSLMRPILTRCPESKNKLAICRRSIVYKSRVVVRESS